MNNENYRLNINSDSFASLRNDFDDVLKRTLANMTSKQSENATLTVKLAITLSDGEAPDFDGDDDFRKITKPAFAHKVSSVMQIKTEESGSTKGEYELVYDEDLQDFVMKQIDYGQQSFDFDSDEDYKGVHSIRGLPSGKDGV